MLKAFFEKPLYGKDTSHYLKHLKIWHAGEKYTSEFTFVGEERIIKYGASFSEKAAVFTATGRPAKSCPRPILGMGVAGLNKSYNKFRTKTGIGDGCYE